MILLEYHNKIIEDLLKDRYKEAKASPDKFEAIDMTIADFDAVVFHITTDADAKNIIRISISVKCWKELESSGVQDVLKRIYSTALVSTESGYNATLQLDLTKPPADLDKFIHDVALLKRNSFAAPFYKVFADVEAKKGGGPLIELNYRDDEALYIKPESDRAIVIFSIRFKDADDIIFAKVFLQEYADARKTMSNAPSVTYSQKEPPLELKGVRNLKTGDSQGYVSFVLFAPHVSGTKKEKTIDNIQTFRNYLHYHIKCSKAFIHTRMRNRVRTFLQVLNRARNEVGGAEKKTITGKTFKRADDPQTESMDYNI